MGGGLAMVDPTLLTITDLNFDGIVQLAEIAIGGDIIVLGTPEIAGLPYRGLGPGGGGRPGGGAVHRGRPAADDRQRAGHDLYYKMIAPTAPTARRVTVSKSAAAGRGRRSRPG
jgi:cation/acetate symporter